jgi:cytoskeletal protein RodZ
MATVDPSSAYRSGPHPSDPIGVGMLLRRAREQRGLTLEQVAHETKIPVHRLAAFERDGLPESNRGFYQRAQIRVFARAVDLGEPIVVAELERDATPPTPARLPQAPPDPTRSARRHLVVMLVVCAAVVIGISRPTTWEPARRGTENRDARIAPLSPPSPSPPSPPAPREPTEENVPTVVPPSPLPVVEDTVTGEAEAAPEAPIPALTELVITTQPAEAQVTVNDVGWGATPIVIRYLTPGEKRVRVTKDAYSSAERVIDVVANQSTTVNIELLPTP